MLKDEQASELLARCEEAVGKQLRQVRGNLRKAVTRAAAVWELLVIEAAANIAGIQYEPHPGASPDVLLASPEGRKIWIEAAYLYPRFWENERKSEAVVRWIYHEAARLKIDPYKLAYRLDGAIGNNAGPVRTLPELHKKKEFLREPGLRNFLDQIKLKPDERNSYTHPYYSLVISYLPHETGPFLSGGGLVEESPKVVEEHAVYRVLKEKARQHRVQGPRIVCVGSDESPALTRVTWPAQINMREAILAAFSKYRSLSGVITVSIREKQAQADIFINRRAKEALTKQEIQFLQKLDFNRWKYTYSLAKWEHGDNDGFRRVGGDLVLKPGRISMKIEIPTNIVMDALTGKTNLFKLYGLSDGDPEAEALRKDWTIKSCRLKEGNIELAQAPKLVLELIPAPPSVYWDKKTA